MGILPPSQGRTNFKIQTSCATSETCQSWPRSHLRWRYHHVISPFPPHTYHLCLFNCFPSKQEACLSPFLTPPVSPTHPTLLFTTPTKKDAFSLVGWLVGSFFLCVQNMYFFFSRLVSPPFSIDAFFYWLFSLSYRTNNKHSWFELCNVGCFWIWLLIY